MQINFHSTYGNLSKCIYDFKNDVFKVALTNKSPDTMADKLLGDIAEIPEGNGYVAGGSVIDVTCSSDSGVKKVFAKNLSITASGGSIGPFRYLVFYDATQTTPLKPLIAFCDLGSSHTLENSGDRLDVNFNRTDCWLRDSITR